MDDKNRSFSARHRWDMALVAGLVLAAVTFCLMMNAAGRVETGVLLPGFDPAAVAGQVPDLDARCGYSVLSDASVPFEVGICGRPVRSEDGLDVYLTNPEGNSTWLMVQVLDGSGNVLGKSGLVRPGEYVRTVQGDFSGTDSIGLKVMGYQPDLYYSDGSVVLRTVIG